MESQVIYVLHLAIICIYIPFFIISFCYFQIVRELYFKNKVGPQNIAAQEEALEKRKLVKLSLSITATFVVCFFPVTVALILESFDPKDIGKKYVRYTSVVYFLEAFINPLLYAYQSTNVRQAFKAMLRLNH
jgi:ABC-type polysaccharide transport system permease subunit